MKGERMKRRLRTSVAVLAAALGVLFFSSPLRANISDVNSLTTNTYTSGTFNFNYANTNNANLLVVMATGYNGSGPGLNVVCFNSRPLSQAVTAISASTVRNAGVWYLYNPDVGTYAVTGSVSYSSSSRYHLWVYSVAGVDTNLLPQCKSNVAPSSASSSVAPTNLTSGAWAFVAQDCDYTATTVPYTWTDSQGGTPTSFGCWTYSGSPYSTVGACTFKNLATGDHTITGTAAGIAGRNVIAVACFAPSTNGTSFSSGPTIANTGVDGLTYTNAALHGNLSSTGSAATAVSVFWGKTDQSPSTNGWGGTYFFGSNVSTGALVATATGLVGNTTYYYRYFATNSAGFSWASQGTFTTPSDIPVLSNVSATPSGTNAIVSGTVTGAPSITVFAFWGLTDGGTNAGNWSNSTNLGVVTPGAAFTATASGLTQNTTYYYRCMGSNYAGIGWSPAATTFHTFNPNVLTWTNTASSGSWGTAGNWDHTPRFDGSEDVNVGTASIQAVDPASLDGDRIINSLTTGGNYKFNITAGNPASSKLIIRSGNFTRNNSAGYNQMSAAFQVDDGTNSNTNATWFVGGASALDVNRIIGLAGTTITKTGVTANLVFNLDADNSTNYFGKWVLLSGVTVLNANHALGTNSVIVGNNSELRANGNILASNELVFAGSGGYLCAATSNRLTQAGNLTGSGFITLGDYNNEGAVMFTGTNNTHSGGVSFYRGAELIVCGFWTNAGAIDLWSGLTSGSGFDPSLQGNGTIGMANNAKVFSSRPELTSTYGNQVYIAPCDGTPQYPRADHNPLLLGTGTVGTLTIGTPGNNNAVELYSNMWYLADVTTTTNDLLVVNGTLNLTPNYNNLSPYNGLSIKGTLSSSRSYTLAQFTSRTGKFARVYWNASLVANPENYRAINGTHTLVYNATSIQLVGPPPPGTLMLLR